MTGILERIQALEERVAATRSEIDRLKSEIVEALALAPKVEELANTGGKNACTQGLHGDYIVIF